MVTVSRAKRSASPNGRILGTRVPARFPTKGPVSVLIFGEAPGPNGADKSGIPFFGDLPLVGPLFRNKETSETKSELLVFITPNPSH